MTEIKEKIVSWMVQHEEELCRVSDYIFAHPETALTEVESSRCLADYLETQGFAVSWGLAELSTAFVAEWGSGEPILGFLAEYDALPGLGQEICARQSTTGRPGHGCGHNLLGTACAAAACALKDWMEKAGAVGTIRVYGCPAEETVIGKVQMNDAGVFDELSAAVTWHPFDRNRVSYDIWQAHDIREYHFHGRAAHAAKHPEQGRSALDAAELMNVGVNYLREHVPTDVRMHYGYISENTAPNIVPAYAATRYFIRSSDWDSTRAAAERVDDCARGAALMTGCLVEIERVSKTREMKVNRALAESFYHAMEQIPVPEYTQDELDFAEEISMAAKLDNDGVYFTGLEELEDEPQPIAIGTDVSEVSHTVPTVLLSAACMCRGTPLHHWAATAQAGMSIGKKGMLYAAACMALGSARLIKEPQLLKEAWRLHREK